MQKFSTALIFILFILFKWSSLPAQDTLSGEWKGAIDVQGTQLTIITHFQTAENGFKGTIDIPQQGAKGIPLQIISLSEKDSVQFEFMAGMGMAKFRGIFKSDTTIAGTFHQSGQKFPFHLEKLNQPSNSQNDTVKGSDKITDYRTKEIIIKNDSTSIAGTLTWPKKEQTNLLVIMISGSGAQDRDETMRPISNFKPFALLADSLTTNGIATFRFDDRGVGQSSGNFADATLNMLASDVEAIVDSLKNYPNHQFTDIILLGHSQGGIVAGKVGSRHPDIDKIILMASTGVTFQKILRFQAQQKFEEAGINRSLVQKEINAREKLMEAVVNNGNIKEAKREYQEIFENIQLSAGVDSLQASSMAQRQANALTKTFRSPQMRSLLYYDPARDLKKIDIPVLALFGGKDTQVTIEMNKDPIEQALQKAGVNYRVKIFENANHLFQKAETGQVQEYSTLEKKFVDGFISTITDWIKNQQ